MRERAAWLTVLPLLVVGELAGHSLAYRIVAPDGAERARLLARTGHDYLAYLHPLPASCVALLVVALARRLGDGFAGAALRRPPSWLLALLPAGAFLLQEYLERLVHNGGIDWTTAGEPAVVVGVLLQLPCGILCVWVVRALTRLAHAAGRVLGERLRLRPSPLRALCSSRPVAQIALLRPLVLAGGGAERGPPLPR